MFRPRKLEERRVRPQRIRRKMAAFGVTCFNFDDGCLKFLAIS